MPVIKKIEGAREIECSVLEESAGQLRASELGEIVPASKHGFYSYQAKYIDADGAALCIPAELPPQQAHRIQELAVEVFRLLGCEGLARVDFFVKGDDVFVNEVNTLVNNTRIIALNRSIMGQLLPDDVRKIQISLTLTYPGTIKAIHYHSEQTDLWAPVSGMVQVS
jgi:hypothetical protein